MQGLCLAVICIPAVLHAVSGCCSGLSADLDTLASLTATSSRHKQVLVCRKSHPQMHPCCLCSSELASSRYLLARPGARLLSSSKLCRAPHTLQITSNLLVLTWHETLCPVVKLSTFSLATIPVQRWCWAHPFLLSVGRGPGPIPLPIPYVYIAELVKASHRSQSDTL